MMSDLSILGTSSTQLQTAFESCLQPRVRLSAVTSAVRLPPPKSPAVFLPADQEPGNRDHYELNVKAGSMTTCSAPLLASGTITSRLLKSLSFFLQSHSRSPASNSACWPGDLEVAHVVSLGLRFPSVKWGKP